MKSLSYTICLVAVLTILAGTANATLVAQWTFDEGSGTVAHDAVGGNNGTLYNGAGWTSGVSGSAASFNRSTSSYIDVPDNVSLRFSQADSFTIAFWAKPSYGGEVIAKMRGSDQSGFFGYEIGCASQTSFAFGCERSYSGRTVIETGTNSMSFGNWYYVAAVYDNKSMKIYLNGELKNTATFGYNTGTTEPDGNLKMGVRSADMQYYYSGGLDDLRFYNEALNANSISQLYQTTPEPATLLLLGLGGMLIRRR
ncbi:MAG: LamG domain-containing protein [Sedimentisphaerales bacterium]|nr:LamG domain-containing protein [Sedimentisphaerales bacterium]